MTQKQKKMKEKMTEEERKAHKEGNNHNYNMPPDNSQGLPYESLERRIYKHPIFDIFNMFPSDPSGSLDDFSSISYNRIGRVFLWKTV